ncbi:MAG: hypothetical protein WC834_04265, partial [Eubacteriales bacterium]
MKKVFKRKFWMQVTAIVLAFAINFGALDGIIRFTVQEFALGSFDGFLKSASAKSEEGNKKKNVLPDSAGPKKLKNPLAEEAKEKLEVVAKRTENSKTFKIGEDEYKTEVYQEPVHYTAENGEQIDIDNTLVESAEKDYRFENRANSLKVRFAGKTGGKALAQVQQREYSIKWFLLDGQEAQGNTCKNNITYSGIEENTDLRYSIDGETLKEEIILKSPDAPPEFKFALTLKNVAYELQEDGTIKFVDRRSGDTVWVMPKPFMYDAKGETSRAVTADMGYRAGQPVLTVKADQEWLSSPG